MKKKLNKLFRWFVISMIKFHQKRAKYYGNLLYYKLRYYKLPTSTAGNVDLTTPFEIPNAYVDSCTRWHGYDYSWVINLVNGCGIKVSTKG